MAPNWPHYHQCQGAGWRILWNKMYQHKDPIYYTFGAGQKNYQCHGTDGLVSLAPLTIVVLLERVENIFQIFQRKKDPRPFHESWINQNLPGSIITISNVNYDGVMRDERLCDITWKSYWIYTTTSTYYLTEKNDTIYNFPTRQMEILKITFW